MRRFSARVAGNDEYGGAFFFSSHLRVPSLQKQGSVNFLLDTGASGVVIGENDLTRLGISIRSLPSAHEKIAGWGGTTDAYVIEDTCIILVDEGGQSETFDVKKVVCGANPKDARNRKGVARTKTISIPSVIGRDFLRQHGLIAHIDLRREDIYIYQE